MLHPEDGAAQIKCQYCGSVNLIQAKSTGKYTMPQTNSNLRKFVLIFFVALPLLAGLGIYLYYNSIGTNLLHEWYSSGLLIDSNNDNVLDIIGFSGSPMKQNNLTLIDGSTGEILARENIETEQRPGIFLATEKYVAAVKANLTLTLFSTDSLQEVHTFMLSDNVRNYAIENDRQLLLLLYNSEYLCIDLRKMQIATCPENIGEMEINETLLPYDYFENEVVENNTHYVATTGEGQTQLITISAKSGDNNVLWETPLRYKVSGEKCVAVTPQTVVTYGVNLDEQNHGTLIGLEKETGRIRYEKDFSSTWSADVNMLVYNGQHIILCWGFGIMACNANTGEVEWRVGGR